MAYITRYKVPSPDAPTFRSGYDFDAPSLIRDDEIIYDPRTYRYLTVSQEQEIYRLRDELEKQKKEKKRELENIISYFYKRN